MTIAEPDWFERCFAESLSEAIMAVNNGTDIMGNSEIKVEETEGTQMNNNACS